MTHTYKINYDNYSLSVVVYFNTAGPLTITFHVLITAVNCIAIIVQCHVITCVLTMYV